MFSSFLQSYQNFVYKANRDHLLLLLPPPFLPFFPFFFFPFFSPPPPPSSPPMPLDLLLLLPKLKSPFDEEEPERSKSLTSRTPPLKFPKVDFRTLSSGLRFFSAGFFVLAPPPSGPPNLPKIIVCRTHSSREWELDLNFHNVRLSKKSFNLFHHLLLPFFLLLHLHSRYTEW